MDELGLVPVCDLISRHFPVEIAFEVSQGNSRMALQESADINEEGALVDKLSSNHRRGAVVHVEEAERPNGCQVPSGVRRFDTLSQRLSRVADTLRLCQLIAWLMLNFPGL